MDDIIGDVRQALEEHNTAASQALADSTEAWHITSSRNFSQLSWNIREHITMAENMSDRVEQTLTQVCNFEVTTFWCITFYFSIESKLQRGTCLLKLYLKKLFPI